MCMQNNDVVTQAVFSQCEFNSTWLAAELIKEHFKQLAVIKFWASSGVMSQKHGIVLVIIIVGKCVLGRLFLSGTSNFGMVEQTSAAIFRVRDSVFLTALRTFKVQLRGTRFQNREELKFAVCSAVPKFRVDFYKGVYSYKWVKRHMKSAACGGSYFEKE